MSRRDALSVVVAVGLLLWVGACEPEKKQPPKEEQKTAAEEKQGPTWDLDGKLAPELHVSTWLNTEKPLTLKEFQKQKFVLIEFWFTGCPHCVAEAPRMQEFHNRFTGPKFQVITIVSDLKDNRQSVEKFIKEHNITFPIAIDENAKTFAEYDMRTVPFAYIVNRYGYVVWQGHPHYLEASRISEILALADGK